MCHIYEYCPRCNSKLESILDKDGFIINFWCSQCGLSWKLEELEIKEPTKQKSLLDYQE
jgi:transcription elongation factor Elf1